MNVYFHGFPLIFLPPHSAFAHETGGHVVVKNTDIATDLTPPLTSCEFLGKWPPVYIGFLMGRTEIQQALCGLKEPISVKYSESCSEHRKCHGRGSRVACHLLLLFPIPCSGSQFQLKRNPESQAGGGFLGVLTPSSGTEGC